MDALTRLITNLEIVASIPDGAKIGTSKEFLTVDYPHPLQFARRWFNSDNRDKALLAIKIDVEAAIYLVYVLGLAGRHQDVSRLHDVLEDCIVGLSKLSATYYNDANACSIIKVIVASIRACNGELLPEPIS